MLTNDGDRQKNTENAITAAEKAVALSPNNAHQRYFLAQIYYFTISPDNDHLEKGFEQIQKAIELDWHDPEYYYLLSKIYQIKNEELKALDTLNRCLDIYNDEAKEKIIFFKYINENILDQRLNRIKSLKFSIEQSINNQDVE